ncbi:hypothetical protein QOZ80_4BG0352940 [Eleusine coracana subsp. coracana]|nr:hypothetical protein QOZ80_4BG0352940 [Eleusine coracana subsp. coracana]
MHAAGRIYWRYQKAEVLLSLDTRSMEFSHVALPPVPELYRPQALYAVGDMEDGACCLVCVLTDPNGRYYCDLQVWRRNEEAGSWEFLKCWVPNKLYRQQVRQVCTVTAGVVLFCTDNGGGRYRYLAFRLKNLIAGARVPPEADFINGRGLTVYLYLLAWPSSSYSSHKHSHLTTSRCSR